MVTDAGGLSRGYPRHIPTAARFWPRYEEQPHHSRPPPLALLLLKHIAGSVLGNKARCVDVFAIALAPRTPVALFPVPHKKMRAHVPLPRPHDPKPRRPLSLNHRPSLSSGRHNVVALGLDLDRSSPAHRFLDNLCSFLATTDICWQCDRSVDSTDNEKWLLRNPTLHSSRQLVSTPNDPLWLAASCEHGWST